MIWADWTVLQVLAPAYAPATFGILFHRLAALPDRDRGVRENNNKKTANQTRAKRTQ